MRHTVYIV